MPTMIYRTSDNKRVPSVTTINKIGQETGGLIHWAWSLGIDGIDYRNVRDDAVDAGNVGHFLAECAIKNMTPTDEELKLYGEVALAAGKVSFGAFKQWRDQSKISILHSELPLVSERYGYGGCPDAITFRVVAGVSPGDPGSRCYGLGDWKSGALYPDHLCQIAAYKQLWDENNPDKKISEFHLCRFNRETGAFTHHFETDLGDAWLAFKLKRELYDLLAQLKKRV